MFSKAEQLVVDLLPSGLTHKEIGERLFVSEKTVKFHTTNIYRKIGAKNKVDFINKYSTRFGAITAGGNVREYEDSDTDTVLVKDVLPSKHNDNNQSFRQLQTPKKSQEDKIQYVNSTFKVTDTLNHLHTMMTEVTKKEITPATVSAACNCVSRLNETVNTAIQAARFLNER